MPGGVRVVGDADCELHGQAYAEHYRNAEARRAWFYGFSKEARHEQILRFLDKKIIVTKGKGHAHF